MSHEPVAVPPTPAGEGFAVFGLRAELMRAITEAGFTVPSPIQALAIPAVLSGRDLIAQAQTGTGKTAAFGLPAMHRIAPGGNNGIEILVITPTRELAAQVSEELYRLGRHAGARTVAVYGGQSSRRQVEMVERGANIVVATPGRLLDLLTSGRIRAFTPKTVVLDEADEMLDMGFAEDIEAIFTHLPKTRQTLLFSATMPPAIRRLAERILTAPQTIDLTTTAEFKTDVEQFFYVIEESERAAAVSRLIDSEEPSKAIVFCRTKRETEQLCTTLVARGLAARSLHGDIEQDQRQIAIAAFKKGAIDILVATDVAARGLDVSDVSHVFNYHMPFDQESYVHRIGRTGRAGRKGRAITLVTAYEFGKLRRIQHAIKASFIHGEIPSIADVHKRHDAKLIKALCKQTIHDGVVDILAQLNEEMDVGEAACKLLSMLIERRAVSGPDRIGLSGKRLESVLGRGRRTDNAGYRPSTSGARRRRDDERPRPEVATRPDDRSFRRAGPAQPARPDSGAGQFWDGKQWVRGHDKKRPH
jgi:ATP-dependent RNA helicase DeaD